MLPIDMIQTSSLVSWDGQIYLRCENCNREARLNYKWAVDPANFPESVCANCGSQLKEFVRHLNHGSYRCRDCQNRFESESADFDDLSCAICGSSDLELLASEISPPFPKTFDQIAPPKPEPWGLSVLADLEQVQDELGLSASSLDFAGHLLLNVRFCERLRQVNDYPPELIDIPILNLEANFLLEHCKRTESLDSGLNALDLFEYVSSLPEHKGSADYVIAHASDILLVRFSESELAAAGRPTLRADAIERARSVVAAAQQEFASNPAKLFNVAATEVLLSRLLSLGNASSEEKLEAIKIADVALKRNVLSAEGAEDVRVARAMNISDLPDVDSKLLDEAIIVFERYSKLLRDAPESPTRFMNVLFNLSALYQRRARPEDAVRVLIEAAQVARMELGRAGSADMLAERGNSYQIVFEALADALAECGRGREAVAAYETLRGSVLRLANDEKLRSVTAVRAVMQMLAEMDPEALSTEPDDSFELPSPDIDSVFDKIRSLLDTETVVVYYGWVRRRMTALLIAAGPDGNIFVEPWQWPLDFDWGRVEESVMHILTHNLGDMPAGVPPLFNAIVFGNPSPLRNKRFMLASKEAYKHLLAPIEDRLRALRARTLVVCTAGVLSSVSLETISDQKRPGWFLADDFSVCYLPSLGVASNISSYDQARGQSLLMIGYSGTDIPGVDAEIEAIRNVWRGECRVLRGSELNKRIALEELAKEFDFIHFAGHGIFDHENPLQSAFYFASGSSPDSWADAYRLTAEDLLKVRLVKHPTVTLSACSSGVTAGAAAHRLTGLLGSLFQSGARAIIASRWPVADEFSLELMRHTYASLATGAAPFAAFTQAQADLRLSRSLEEWGAFSYFGLP